MARIRNGWTSEYVWDSGDGRIWDARRGFATPADGCWAEEGVEEGDEDDAAAAVVGCGEGIMRYEGRRLPGDLRHQALSVSSNGQKRAVLDQYEVVPDYSARCHRQQSEELQSTA